MNNIKIYCTWDLNFEIKHQKQIELYVDKIPTNVAPNNVIRFVFLLEPPEIMNLTRQAIQGWNSKCYNHLFTHNQELLDAIPNSYVFPLASTWIKGYDFPEKKFEISALVGGKRMAEGHILRQNLWFRENKIKNPTKFFLSGAFGGIQNYNNNPVLGDSKNPLFDSQFHICIENTKRKNWFTEKLIDCFETNTIPIYYGCPNIGDWFDERGMIIVNDLKEIIEASNNLTLETYEKMLPYIEDNFKKSKDYTDIAKRLKDKILEILNK